MARAPGLNALLRRAAPAGDATQADDSPPQDAAYFRTSDAPAPADPTTGGRELHNRRMSHPAGGPRRMSRSERRRPEQTDNER